MRRNTDKTEANDVADEGPSRKVYQMGIVSRYAEICE